MLPAGMALAGLIPATVFQPPCCDLGMLVLPKLLWGEGEGPTSGGGSGLCLMCGTQLMVGPCLGFAMSQANEWHGMWVWKRRPGMLSGCLGWLGLHMRDNVTGWSHCSTPLKSWECCVPRCTSDGTVGGCGGRGKRRRQLLLLGSWLINAL